MLFNLSLSTSLPFMPPFGLQCVLVGGCQSSNYEFIKCRGAYKATLETKHKYTQRQTARVHCLQLLCVSLSVCLSV